MSLLNGHCVSFLRRNGKQLRVLALNPINSIVELSGIQKQGKDNRNPRSLSHNRLSKDSLCFFHTKARRLLSRQFLHSCEQISVITTRCYSDDSKMTPQESLALRSKTKMLLQCPNWSQMTVDFVLQNAEPDFIAVGKDALYFIVDSHTKDTKLETECNILMLLASLVEERRNAVIHGTGSSVGAVNETVIPISSHLEFGLLLILMRISLDIHLQVRDDKPTIPDQHNGDYGAAKTYLPNKLNVLVGDILITSLIRLISDKENPSLLKKVFMAFSDSLENVVRTSSSTMDLGLTYDHHKHHLDESKEPSSPNTETILMTSNSKPRKHQVTKQDGASLPCFENSVPVPDRLLSHGFPRKDLSVCCEALLLNDDMLKDLRDSARNFGVLLSQAAFLQSTQAESKAEAETLLDKALSHLSCFPDSKIKTYLTDVSKDFVHCL